jgi:hypothetical protein
MNRTKLLMTAESGQDVYRCDLRDLEALGVECQWSLNGVLLQTRRFTSALVAVQWADEQRRAILPGPSSGHHTESGLSRVSRGDREILTTGDRNGPWCYCRRCQRFWHVSPLTDADTARPAPAAAVGHEGQRTIDGKPSVDRHPGRDDDDR